MQYHPETSGIPDYYECANCRIGVGVELIRDDLAPLKMSLGWPGLVHRFEHWLRARSVNPVVGPVGAAALSSPGPVGAPSEGLEGWHG